MVGVHESVEMDLVVRPVRADGVQAGGQRVQSGVFQALPTVASLHVSPRAKVQREWLTPAVCRPGVISAQDVPADAHQHEDASRFLSRERERAADQRFKVIGLSRSLRGSSRPVMKTGSQRRARGREELATRRLNRARHVV